jgi:hypothetical protein
VTVNQNELPADYSTLSRKQRKNARYQAKKKEDTKRNRKYDESWTGMSKYRLERDNAHTNNRPMHTMDFTVPASEYRELTFQNGRQWNRLNAIRLFAGRTTPIHIEKLQNDIGSPNTASVEDFVQHCRDFYTNYSDLYDFNWSLQSDR